MWRVTTKVILISLFILLAIYDVFAVVNGGNMATISRTIYYWFADYPIVSLGFGILLGHLFVPQHIVPGERVKEGKDEPAKVPGTASGGVGADPDRGSV
jgi:hypothetical protein